MGLRAPRCGHVVLATPTAPQCSADPRCWGVDLTGHPSRSWRTQPLLRVSTMGPEYLPCGNLTAAASKQPCACAWRARDGPATGKTPLRRPGCHAACAQEAATVRKLPAEHQNVRTSCTAGSLRLLRFRVFLPTEWVHEVVPHVKCSRSAAQACSF